MLLMLGFGSEQDKDLSFLVAVTYCHRVGLVRLVWLAWLAWLVGWLVGDWNWGWGRAGMFLTSLLDIFQSLFFFLNVENPVPMWVGQILSEFYQTTTSSLLKLSPLCPF